MSWFSYLRLWLPLALVAALGLWVNYLEQAAYQDGYKQAQDEGEIALLELEYKYLGLELERAQVAAANAKTAAKRLQDEQARNDQLAANLAAEQRKHRQVTDYLTEEIARVNDLYREALDAPPKPLPACVFTAGFVRVWDEATGARAPMLAAADPQRVAAQGPQTLAAEQLDSGLGQRDILTHHVRYAEQCRNTAAQLDALIDTLQGQP
ncbi:hypothetical protein [Stutzerimonas stutzeri]|uniref:hypothetical protein n=1 Tax=Stutzerimonas stutzeri TaxID=316 RepID=UPI00210AA03B|nr:hypothetical protein [Stutzerimonas stutzeri]MCQ4242400.1 hypothetical protein [Stutzerimonas stutzeri]